MGQPRRAMNAPAVIWTISAILGMLVSSRNLMLAWPDWWVLRAEHARPSLLVTAWMHVRSHALYFCVHFLFFCVGLEAILIPRPSTELQVAGILALIGATYLLVLLSWLMHVDRERATKLAREGR